MRILGIDPGLATVGLGLIEVESGISMRALDWLTIETSPTMTHAARLNEIRGDLEDFLKQSKPDLAVIEKLFFAVNEQTAFSVAEARGVILQTVEEAGVAIIEPTPLQLKSCITGDGQADKKQVQDMLVRMLKLEVVPRPDDASDALALAVYGTTAKEWHSEAVKQ